MYPGTRPMCLPKTDGWPDGIERCFWRSGINRLGSYVAVHDALRLTGKLTLQASDWKLSYGPRIKRGAEWSLSAWRRRYAPTDLDRQSLLIVKFTDLRPCINFSEVRNENPIARRPAVAVLAAANLSPAMAQATKPVSQVVQWNRTLLVIVRTPGAQPATIHPTRSFAIMHAAIYDAVNAIDGTHKPYLVRLSASHFASQEAAAAAAATNSW